MQVLYPKATQQTIFGRSRKSEYGPIDSPQSSCYEGATKWDLYNSIFYKHKLLRALTSDTLRFQVPIAAIFVKCKSVSIVFRPIFIWLSITRQPQLSGWINWRSSISEVKTAH